MSERCNTLKLSEALYERMCEYVGPHHCERGVVLIKETLDSFEEKIEQLEARLRDCERLCKRRREDIERVKAAADDRTQLDEYEAAYIYAALKEQEDG